MNENSYRHPSNRFLDIQDMDPVFYAVMDRLMPYDEMFDYVVFGEES